MTALASATSAVSAAAAPGPVGRAAAVAEARATLQLAWPVIISQLATMAMGLVDVAFVARLGPEALAGTAIGNSAHWMVVTLTFGILQALDPLLSQAIGAGERARIGGLVWQGVWLAIGLGGAGALLSLDARPVFELLRQPEAVGDAAAIYLRALAPGMVPFLLFVVGRSLLAALGVTRPVMVVALLANLVNAGLDAAWIHGWLGAPALGVRGAGLATSCTRWWMVAALGVVMIRHCRGLDLQLRPPDLGRIGRILRLGMPIGAQNIAEFGVFAAAAAFAGQLGPVALAAHQVALNLAAFVYMMPVGVSIAAAVRVGRAIGAGDPDGAALAGRVALGLGAALMAAGAAVFTAAPGLLARAFAGGDAAVLSLATDLLRIAAVFQVADGVQVVASGALRGAGETRQPMVANLAAHWGVGLPVGWVLAFPLGFGVHGLWWGLTASLVMAAALLARLFWRGEWRRIGRVQA